MNTSIDCHSSRLDANTDSPLLVSLKAAPQSSESLANSLDMLFDDVLIELTDLEIQGVISCEVGIWYAC